MGLLNTFTRPPPVRRRQWNGYAYRFGLDQRCVVSFDVEACEPKNQSPHVMGRRVISFAHQDEVTPTGMPTKEAYQRMRDVETAWVARLTSGRVACWHVGSQTYNGLRELVFEVKDVAAFEQHWADFSRARADLKLFEFEGWQFFNEKIRPGPVGKNHISNRSVIEGLRQAGSRLELPHGLEHCFLGMDRELGAVEAALMPYGFWRAQRAKDSLTMAHEHPLADQDAVDSVTLFLRDLAQKCGAHYDGWGALVVS